jgi:hypothetical protein
MTATDYWEARYATGGSSGAGSRGTNAQAKAAAINAFTARNRILSIVDWGCGDGYLTELLNLNNIHYCGVDVSRTAVGVGLLRFPAHQYVRWEPTSRAGVYAFGEMGLSVDVIFHLTDDDVYERYMMRLFEASRFVVVFSPSKRPHPKQAAHMRYHEWTKDVPGAWELMSEPEDGAGPWVYGR